MAQVACLQCRKTYWTDLPYGVGALAPIFVDASTGAVTRPYGPGWYANLTASGWQNRVSQEVDIVVKSRRRSGNACLVNCLLPWWGDAVSLLLRTNQIAAAAPDVSIIVLIQPHLEWLVPDHIAEVWIVNQQTGNDGLPPAIGQIWNFGLAAKVKELAGNYESLSIPIVVQPAQVSREELAKITSVEPFPRHRWNELLVERPMVTFMWRDDRVWDRRSLLDPRATKLTRAASKIWNRIAKPNPVLEQRKNVIAIAEMLREAVPKVDFAVCGPGRAGGFPPWIKDLRNEVIDRQANLTWIKRSAESHVLLGVLGSHMVLPSGHAGAVLELVPRSFFKQVLTELLVTSDDVREAIYSYRWLPDNIEPRSLCDLVLTVLLNFSNMHYSFDHRFYRPLSENDLHTIRHSQGLRASAMKEMNPSSIADLYGP